MCFTAVGNSFSIIRYETKKKLDGLNVYKRDYKRLNLLNNSTIELSRDKSFSAQLGNEAPIIAPKKTSAFQQFKL